MTATSHYHGGADFVSARRCHHARSGWQRGRTQGPRLQAVLHPVDRFGTELPSPGFGGGVGGGGILALLIALLLVLAPGASTSAAPLNAAGLVIDYGGGRVTYAYVPFAEEKITGIELLQRARVSLLTVSFGGLGDAVCTIDDTGCGVSDCRQRLCQTGDPKSPFWHYLRQTSPGTWSFVATGPSAPNVTNGVIDGWAWTGDSSPAMPSLTMAQLIAKTGAPPLARAAAGKVPPAAVLKTGAQPRRTEQPGWQYLLGGVALLAVAVLGGAAVWRSRRVRRGPAP